MYKRWFIPIAAFAATGAIGGQVQASGRDPLVIPAFEQGSNNRSPQRAAMQPQRQQAAQPVAPRYAAAPQRPAYSQPSRGQYGGGFIEMLMTGRDPTSSRGAVYHAPTVRPQTRQVIHAPAPVRATAPRAPQVHANIGMSDMRPQRMIDPRFMKQEVDYRGAHKAGTIVVDTPNRFLYLVLGNGRALRYGIGVGRPGFEWAGVKTVTRKTEWPDWRPPPEMLKRRPDLPRFMPGGPDNPMGARALYLGSSLYRIHGTNEPETIGQNVSSGCIRMMNDDVIDLYGRVRTGAKVVVM